MLMASTGHASIQAPQSMQESASTTALPSAMLMALLGHSSTQDSQPVHFALSTSAGIQLPFQIGTTNVLRKYGIITHSGAITNENLRQKSGGAVLGMGRLRGRPNRRRADSVAISGAATGRATIRTQAAFWVCGCP